LLATPQGEATAKFREWVNQAEAIAMRTVDAVAGAKAAHENVSIRTGETPVPLSH
jgi:hypothetical protein